MLRLSSSQRYELPQFLLVVLPYQLLLAEAAALVLFSPKPPLCSHLAGLSFGSPLCSGLQI